MAPNSPETPEMVRWRKGEGSSGIDSIWASKCPGHLCGPTHLQGKRIMSASSREGGGLWPRSIWRGSWPANEWEGKEDRSSPARVSSSFSESDFSERGKAESPFLSSNRIPRGKCTYSRSIWAKNVSKVGRATGSSLLPISHRQRV